MNRQLLIGELLAFDNWVSSWSWRFLQETRPTWVAFSGVVFPTTAFPVECVRWKGQKIDLC